MALFQVRIHGRGGQGVVTAAEILSIAAFLDGRHAQALPSFGSERMGAPVVSFCRIDSDPIRRHDPVVEADAVIVQDTTLLRELELFGGLTPEGFVLVNSNRSAEELGLEGLATMLPPGHVRTCPAGQIARRLTGRPLPNSALLGGLAAMTACVPLESLVQAILDRLPPAVADSNAAAAAEGAAWITTQAEAPAHA